MNKLWIYIAIFILTLADVIFTTAGLKLGVVNEANPLMNYFIQKSLPLSMAGVLIFAAGTLYFLYKVRHKIKWLYPALLGVTAVKTYILAVHIRWITLYIIKVM